MDNLDRQARRRAMSHNKSSGTRSTELRFRSLLVRYGVCGWQIGVRSELPGRPDIILRNIRLAVFLDGCFWHGCGQCRSLPRVNRASWRKKIEENQRRDRRASRALARMGWRVMRIWEHELRQNGPSLRKKIASLTEGKPGTP